MKRYMVAVYATFEVHAENVAQANKQAERCIRVLGERCGWSETGGSYELIKLNQDLTLPVRIDK